MSSCHPDQIDELLEYFTRELLRFRKEHPTEPTNAIYAQAHAAVKRLVLEGRIDQISDAIIECYGHDNPMDIAKDLKNERRNLEKEMEGMQG